MDKINKTLYGKILLQADEAKIRGMKKLAAAVLNGLGPVSREDEKFSYSSKDLNTDIYNGLWKLSLNILGYHDLESVDIEKLDAVIQKAASEFVDNIENSLDLENQIGPNEDVLPGQLK